MAAVHRSRFRRVDAAIAVSHATARVMREKWGARDVVVIPNGVDRPGDPRRSGSPACACSRSPGSRPRSGCPPWCGPSPWWPPSTRRPRLTVAGVGELEAELERSDAPTSAWPTGSSSPASSTPTRPWPTPTSWRCSRCGRTAPTPCSTLPPPASAWSTSPAGGHPEILPDALPGRPRSGPRRWPGRWSRQGLDLAARPGLDRRGPTSARCAPARPRCTTRSWRDETGRSALVGRQPAPARRWRGDAAAVRDRGPRPRRRRPRGGAGRAGRDRRRGGRPRPRRSPRSRRQPAAAATRASLRRWDRRPRRRPVVPRARPGPGDRRTPATGSCTSTRSPATAPSARALPSRALARRSGVLVPSAWMTTVVAGQQRRWPTGPTTSSRPRAPPRVATRPTGGLPRAARPTPRASTSWPRPSTSARTATRSRASPLVVAGDDRFVDPADAVRRRDRPCSTLGVDLERRGWVPREQFFDDVDVVVVPSVASESFGLVAAEAMAAARAGRGQRRRCAARGRRARPSLGRRGRRRRRPGAPPSWPRRSTPTPAPASRPPASAGSPTTPPPPGARAWPRLLRGPRACLARGGDS